MDRHLAEGCWPNGTTTTQLQEVEQDLATGECREMGTARGNPMVNTFPREVSPSCIVLIHGSTKVGILACSQLAISQLARRRRRRRLWGTIGTDMGKVT